MATIDEPQVRVDEEPTAAVEVSVTGEIEVIVERPAVHLPPGQWVRQNLLSNVPNTVLTLVVGLALAYGAFRLLRFAFVTADWEIVRRNLRLFTIGPDFPVAQLWRVWAAVYLLVGAIGLVVGAAGTVALEQARAQGHALTRATPVGLLQRYWPIVLVMAVGVSFTRTVLPGLLLVGAIGTLLAARYAGAHLRGVARFTWLLVLVAVVGSIGVLSWFDGVPWDRWGGLHLTLFVTVAGIAFATPFGIALALARRSSLPALRWVTVSYIELFRGVPLITLLFMGQFVVPLFFPNTVEAPSRLARALIAITLFEAAYIAETVRGGLQGIPKGQTEAAMALGLGPWSTMRRIIMPQALRNVIPAMVGQFISLFKDTTLLAALTGLAPQFLGIVAITVNQPEFQGQGLHTVGFAFAAMVYWAVSYSMSRESRRLERRLGVGER